MRYLRVPFLVEFGTEREKERVRERERETETETVRENEILRVSPEDVDALKRR